jgi:hypothetical protein
MTTDLTPTPADAVTEEILTDCRLCLADAIAKGERAPHSEQTIRDILSDPAGWDQFRRGCVFNGRKPDWNLEAMRLTIALYNAMHGGDALPVIDRLSVFAAECGSTFRDIGYCEASIRNLAIRNCIPDAETMPIVTLAKMWCIRHDLGHVDPVCIPA